MAGLPMPQSGLRVPKMIPNDQKGSKWSQNGPKWSKTCYIDHFGIILGPLRPLWDVGKPAIFGPKRAILDPSAHMIEG